MSLDVVKLVQKFKTKNNNTKKITPTAMALNLLTLLLLFFPANLRAGNTKTLAKTKDNKNGSKIGIRYLITTINIAMMMA